MSASQIIEKYHHELNANQLIFLTWLADKYPNGVLRSKINYPHKSQSWVTGAIFDLEKMDIVKSEGKKSYNSMVIPCL